MPKINKLSTCLWFDGNAEEAAKFYVSVFPQAKILHTSHSGENGPGPAGSVLVVDFELAGSRFMALNGGPMFKFSEAISLVINCDNQQEIDHYWNALIADGGSPSQCGWLKDKFGVSWQVVPAAICEWLSEPKASARVMHEVMQMSKLDFARMQAAARG